MIAQRTLKNGNVAPTSAFISAFFLNSHTTEAETVMQFFTCGIGMGDYGTSVLISLQTQNIQQSGVKMASDSHTVTVFLNVD